MATEAALSNVSSRAVKLSARPLNVAESKVLTVLLDQLSAHYPHQTITNETGEIWREAFEMLVRRYTLPRLQTALREFLIKPGQKFFPHPGEIAEALEEMKTSERAQLLRDHPFLACGKCDGGIVLVNRDGTPYDAGKGGPVVMKDCSCKTAWRQTMRTASQQLTKPAEQPSTIVRMPYRDDDANSRRA